MLLGMQTMSCLQWTLPARCVFLRSIPPPDSCQPQNFRTECVLWRTRGCSIAAQTAALSLTRSCVHIATTPLDTVPIAGRARD